MSPGTASSTDRNAPSGSPADHVEALDRAATVLKTPCGTGRMVWRRWGGGSPVVLVHGGGGAWSHWIRNIPVLMQRHTVYACDLPGLGDSDMPESLDIDCIAATVEQGIRELLGGQPFDLVGFSFGGPVSAYVASKMGAQVRHYVLTASRFVLDPEFEFPTLINWKKLQDPAERADAHRRNLNIIMIADNGKIDDLALHIQASNTPRARYYGPSLNPGEKLHEFLPAARPSGSITGISGVHDQLGREIMDRQAAALKAIHPGGRFHPIDGAGHWVQYEAADAYNEILMRVLAGPA